MPAPIWFISASYLLTVVILGGLALGVWLNLRRWAARARDAQKS